MSEHFLVFSTDTMSRRLRMFQENGIDNMIRFFGNDRDEVIAVTDVFDSADTALAAVNTEQKSDKFYGSDKNWLELDMFHMTISDMANGSVSNAVALYTMITFGKKTMQEFGAFLEINRQTRSIRRGMTNG